SAPGCLRAAGSGWRDRLIAAVPVVPIAWPPSFGTPFGAAVDANATRVGPSAPRVVPDPLGAEPPEAAGARGQRPGSARSVDGPSRFGRAAAAPVETHPPRPAVRP